SSLPYIDGTRLDTLERHGGDALDHVAPARRESSGKRHQRQEQSENKAANGPVIESCFGSRRRAVRIGRKLDVESLGKLARWDRPPRAHVGGWGPRSLVRGDKLCATGECGTAHLDRSGNRRAVE